MSDNNNSREESSPEQTTRGTTKPTTESNEHRSSSGGLPWGFVAVAAAGVFLLTHQDELGQKGSIIIVIGAIVLGVLSANMMAKK